MRIKTTLRVGAVFSIGITLVVSAILFLASRQVDTAVRQSRHAYEVVQKVFESNLLLNEYLLRHKDETAAEWQAVHVVLSDLLGAPRLASVETGNIAEQIRLHHNMTGTLFATLVEGNREQRKNRDEIISFLDLEEKVVGDLTRESGAMVSLAGKLADLSHAGAVGAQRRATLSVVIFTAVVTLVLAVGLITIAGSIVRPLLKLKDATRIIADGNLEHTVEVAGNNEIGDLALAFNAMTYKLKDMYKGLQDAFNEMSRKLREAKKETKE